MRLGQASNISHAYQLVTGKHDYNPETDYGRFHEPKWVIEMARVFFDRGSPYAERLENNLAVLQYAVKLRNRVEDEAERFRLEQHQRMLEKAREKQEQRKQGGEGSDL